MTLKTRNWLLALFILALPFIIFCACLVSELAKPAH